MDPGVESCGSNGAEADLDLSDEVESRRRIPIRRKTAKRKAKAKAKPVQVHYWEEWKSEEERIEVELYEKLGIVEDTSKKRLEGLYKKCLYIAEDPSRMSHMVEYQKQGFAQLLERLKIETGL